MRTLPFGKRLPTAIYLHRDALDSCACPASGFIVELAQTHQVGGEFNLVKFHTDAPKVTFLCYPEFFDAPHPSLERAILIDIVSGKFRKTDYIGNPNPPILHRKETFLPPDHPQRAKFVALTSAEEAAGLYDDTTTIGFKLNWQKLVVSKGIAYQGHTLLRLAEKPVLEQRATLTVDRHKTALTRFDFSKPIKTLLEHGLLKAATTVFDYGCGPGSDVAGLESMGFPVGGWDPVFKPDAPKKEADVVNLGYVLNVIEDPVERIETLIEAWSLSQRLLVVSALIRETVPAERAVAFGDGVLTNRNTFQKYFDQHELQTYIEDALEETAVPVSLGIFYVFRDPSELQTFLLARTRRTVSWERLGVRPDIGQPASVKRQVALEKNRELLENFWNTLLQLGRLPLPEEYVRWAELREKMGTPKRVLGLLFGEGREDAFKRAQAVRKADTLVYLASSNLRRRVPFKHVPPPLRADIKAFFGDYTRGLEAGLELLFASGDTDELEIACEETKVGWQDEQAIYFHVSVLKELPPILRAYVACAESLYGDAAQADVVKLHKSSGKVTFLVYDDFVAKPLPQLLLRIKVNLRSRSVQIYDHSGDGQLLCFKERFLLPDHPGHGKMVEVSTALDKLGVVAPGFIGPAKTQVLEAVRGDIAMAERLGLG